MKPETILRGPHIRQVLNFGTGPILLVKPLKFIPLITVHANRRSIIRAKAVK